MLNKENIIYRIKLWFKRPGYEKAQDKILGKVSCSGKDKSKDQWFLNLGVLGPPGGHVEVDGLLLQVHRCRPAFIRALPFHFKGPQILWSPLMEPHCFQGSFYNTIKLYLTGMWSSVLMDMSNEWLLIIGHLWMFVSVLLFRRMQIRNASKVSNYSLIPRLSVAWSLPISLTSVAFYSLSPHFKAMATWPSFCFPTHWHFLPWAIYSTRWWCRYSSSWTSDLCFLELMFYREKQSTIYI